ncbi:MAG: integrase core domain-containing protein [Sedimenticolaceae bacterium]
MQTEKGVGCKECNALVPVDGRKGDMGLSAGLHLIWTTKVLLSNICGERVVRRIKGLGIEEIATAPASPWQNAYVERMIGTLRRELLDYVIILDERHLKRLLLS